MTSIVRQLAACAVLLVLSACPQMTMTMDSGRPPECLSRADCKGGKICTSQHFCDNCSSSGQCNVREVCDVTSKLCAFRDGWGADCSTNDMCPAGQWCKQGLCQDRNSVQLCTDSSQCPQGQICNQVNTVCEEDLGCSTNDDCSSSEVCNTGSHACVPKCTADTQATVCAGAEMCVNSICVQCAKDSDCGIGLKCDAAGQCSAGNRCYSDRDCMVPLFCFLQTGACLPKAPPCTSNDNCASDQRCNVTNGQCIPATCQPDRYEPNNSIDAGTAVTAGTYLGLTLCPGDIDYFALNLARGDQLGVNIDADPFSENGFSAVVKDGSGRALASGHFLVSYVATASQPYYVAISTTDPYQPYDVTFLLSRGIPCDDDMYEPNDFPNMATQLNGTAQIDAQICPQDNDWFHVSPPAGHGVRASLVNYNSGSGLLEICLWDDVVQLSCNSDPTTPIVFADGGTVGGHSNVLVQVHGSTDRVANGYTLKVEFP
jgi:Cys-rich repeat protein